MVKTIDVLSVRGGFACNSSSTHSVVALRAGARAEDDEPDGHFGWDSFTLASREAKGLYLGSMVFGALSGRCGHGLAKILTDDLMGFEGEWAEVDHQSVLSIPVERDGVTPHREFLREYAEWLADPAVAVLGGNDNGGDDHPVLCEAERIEARLLERENDATWVASKDPDGSWLLFDRERGGKVRLRFMAGGVLDEKTGQDDEIAAAFSTRRSEEHRTATPELVDVKITDACPYGCAFCYQGSTPGGRAASLTDIALVTRELGAAGVSEVAIGGGEPTLHPDFPDILRLMRLNGITPNFTTRNLSWLRGGNAAVILRECGSFAFSAHTAEEAERALDGYAKALASRGPWEGTLNEAVGYSAPSKITVQHVVGASPREDLEKITELCLRAKAKLTLLGYKETGRGAEALSAPGAEKMLRDVEGRWVDTVKKAAKSVGKGWLRVGVDTALAARTERRLLDERNTNLNFDTREGAVSMYVDAVEMTMAPSSWSPTKSEPFDEGWRESWKKMRAEKAPGRRP